VQPRGDAQEPSAIMKSALLSLIVCPPCKSPLALEGASEGGSGGPEIEQGALSCATCGVSYPIRDGIPQLSPREDESGHVAESFGFEWQLHHEGGFEQDAVFGRTLEEDVQYFYDGLQVDPASLSGKVFVDAGCGSGTLTTEIARRHPDLTVIGLDINPSIREVEKHGRELPNLHVIWSSVLKPALADESIDILWSNGVIHHTPDTRGAFGELTRLVKPGGRAYIWVYESKLSPLVAVRMLFGLLGLSRWNHRFLYYVCHALSAPTWLAVKVLNLVGRLPGVQNNVHLKILTLDRGYRELVLTWFDVLSPKYRDTLKHSELEDWFRGAGFDDLASHWWPVGISGTRVRQG